MPETQTKGKSVTPAAAPRSVRQRRPHRTAAVQPDATREPVIVQKPIEYGRHTNVKAPLKHSAVLVGSAVVYQISDYLPDPSAIRLVVSAAFLMFLLRFIDHIEKQLK